jgi:hypothetical protein
MSSNATLSNLPVELRMEIVHYLKLGPDGSLFRANKCALQALSCFSSSWHSLVAPSLWAVSGLKGQSILSR